MQWGHTGNTNDKRLQNTAFNGMRYTTHDNWTVINSRKNRRESSCHRMVVVNKVLHS